MSDEELKNEKLNVIIRNQYANLIGNDSDDVISSNADFTFMKIIDPKASQLTNMFFMESTIEYNSHTFDIFDIFETETSLVEMAHK